MSVKTYSFHPVDVCVMCRSPRRRMLGMRLNASQGLRPASAQGIAVSVKQCLDCDLVFADPLPVPSSLSDHYGVPPEEYWAAEEFADWTPAYLADVIATAKRLLPFENGMTALDIGVGLGKGMRSLTHAGFEAWGIEPSKPFYDRAAENVGRERLQLAAVEDAEFSDESFDFITFGAVLEHIYDPSAVLGRILKWLKPGGIIQAEVPSSKHLMARLINRYFRLRGTNYVTHISPMHVPFHLYEFGLKSFEKNAAINGYELAEHRYTVCAIYHAPRLLHGPLRWWMDRTNSGMQLTVYLRKPKAPAA